MIAHASARIVLAAALVVTGALAAPARAQPASAPAPDDGGDRVETIGDTTEPGRAGATPPGDLVETIAGGPESAVAVAAAPGPALTADRFEVHGWARQSIELPLRGRGYLQDAPDPLAVPYDRLIGRTQLLAAGRYSRGRWFELAISGLLSYGLFEQGPSTPSEAFTGFNGRATRGSFEPELRELYLGLFWHRLDVRIGQQRVAWGKGDFISPNDVVNPRDARDPLVGEAELGHVPSPMVRADLDLGPVAVQGIFAPVFIPDTFDVYGSNWAGVQPDAPAGIRGFLALTNRTVDPSLHDLDQRLIQQTSLPSANFTTPSVGGRLSWSIHNLDVSHYYHYGYDGPLIALTPPFAASLQLIDFARAGLADLVPLYAALAGGYQPFTATYVRRHHAGIDAATTLGPFAVRLDAAYDSNRVLYRRDLVGATSPVVQAVASLEYQTGDADKLVLLEAMYMGILDDPGAPLLIYDRNTVGAAGLFRWKLFDPLTVELRAMAGIRPVTEVVRPQLDARWGALTVSVGGLYLNGETGSFGRYYRYNTEVYTRVKYAF